MSVFREFYPGWIYENIYTRVLDELWLYLFLDAEDFEREIARFFDGAEGALATQQAAGRARLPQLQDAPGNAQARSRWAELRSTVELCRRIANIEEDVDRLARGEAPSSTRAEAHRGGMAS